MTIQEKYDYTYDTLSIIETKTEEEQSIFFEFICEDLPSSHQFETGV